MGAGISDERAKRIVYNALKSIQRKLAKLDVTANYSKSELTGSNGTSAFSIYYRRLIASNAENAFLPHITINLDGKREDFDHLGYRLGVDRLKALFGTPTVTA